LFHHSYGLTA